MSAVAEFAAAKADPCVVDATTKVLDAAVAVDIAVVTAVASTDWFAKAVASAVDNVASNAVFAAAFLASVDAVVDAAAAVVETAATVLAAVVLTRAVV